MADKAEGVNFNDRRGNILLSALKVFCHTGYSAARIDDIAKEAGCSHGLVYHYFKNKEEIFNELANFPPALKVMGGLKNLEGGCLEKLKAITAKVLNMIENNEYFVYYFYFFNAIKFIKKDADINKIFNPENHGVTTPHVLVSGLFKEGIELGLIRQGDPEEYTVIYFSVLHGLLMQRLFLNSGKKCRLKSINAENLISIFTRQ